VKRIFVAQTPAEAHLVAGLLDEEGIASYIEGEMLTGARFELGMDQSTLPSINVADEDAARAMEVLRTRGHAPASVPDPVFTAAEEKRQRPGLARFKTFLLLWAGFTVVSFAGSLAFIQVGLAVCAAFALVLALGCLALIGVARRS
jgi:hypothetical protein